MRSDSGSFRAFIRDRPRRHELSNLVADTGADMCCRSHRRNQVWQLERNFTGDARDVLQEVVFVEFYESVSNEPEKFKEIGSCEFLSLALS